MSILPDNTPTLICIPDLTGFTRFVSESDIDFSKKVVPSLLRIIINSNKINLQLGEIEGDAVLFYKTGKLPPLKELVEQCKLFYSNFSTQLNILKENHADDFEKIISTGRLGLKIVLHCGKVSYSNIEGNIKLIGGDVIAAHKLLKNSVSYNEYILISKNVLGHFPDKNLNDIFHWAPLETGSDEYEHIGKIEYSYINLEPLLWEEIKQNSGE